MGLRKGERVDAILVYLAHKAGKCATLDELLGALKPLDQRSKAKDPKMAMLITLHRLKRRGLIRRSWQYLDAQRKKKKRLYCLRSTVG